MSWRILGTGSRPLVRERYQKIAGWFRDRATKELRTPVDRGFVNQDAKDSPDEDFAHNVDTYLFQPEKLRDAAPKIFNWIEANFSRSFSLKEGCRDGEK